MQGRRSIIGVLIAALHLGAVLAPMLHDRLLAPEPAACRGGHAGSHGLGAHPSAVASRGCASSACAHDPATCPLCLALATKGLAALPAALPSFSSVPEGTRLSAPIRETDRAHTVGYGAHRPRAPPACL